MLGRLATGIYVGEEDKSNYDGDLAT